MKYYLFSAVCILPILKIGAQSGVTIQKVGEIENLSGTTIYEFLDPEIYNTSANPGTSYMYSQNFIITNETGEDKEWQIRRVLIDVPPSWDDNLIWGYVHYAASGVDYLTPTNASNPAPTVINNTSTWMDSGGGPQDAQLGIEITPSYIENESATYRYYLYETQTGNLTDSFTVVFNYSLGIEELTTEHIELFPNPASESIIINKQNNLPCSMHIIDNTGKEVATLNMTGSTTRIDLNLLSGFYTCIIAQNDKIIFKERLIIR